MNKFEERIAKSRATFPARGLPLMQDSGLLPPALDVINQNVPIPGELMATLLMCLINDRGANSDLGREYVIMVEERHNSHHVKPSDKHGGNDRGWRECSHDSCRNAVTLLDRMDKPDVMVPVFAIQRVVGKKVTISGKSGLVRIVIEDVQSRIVVA